jgi:predicted ATPase
VLPVVTLLQYVPEGSTVILEQPEIHLHPLAQAGLADVLIQAATHRRVQVILEATPSTCSCDYSAELPKR